MRQEVAVTFDFRPPKSNQLIGESEWTFVPNLKKPPQSVLQISHLQEWPVCTDIWMDYRQRDASSPDYRKSYQLE